MDDGLINRRLTPKRELQQEMIVLCAKLLQTGVTDWDITRHVMRKYKCAVTRARACLKFARSMLRVKYAPRNKDGTSNIKQLVFDAVAVYDGIIQDPTCPHAVKVAAQREKCRLLGLETIKIQLDAHVKTESTVTTMVKVAKDNDEVRALMIKLSRALPPHRELFAEQ